MQCAGHARARGHGDAREGSEYDKIRRALVF